MTAPAGTPHSLEFLLAPTRVAFTDHAAERAARYGIPYGDVADAVLDEPSADSAIQAPPNWLIRKRRLTVIYDWPDGEDETTARVIAVWTGE